MPKCINCGLCCIVKSCAIGEGHEDENGFCEYLQLCESGKILCKKMLEGDEAALNMINGDCILLCDETLYNMYKETYKDNLEFFIRTQKEKNNILIGA